VEKVPVVSPKAPRPVGPYSQAIEAGELIFLSGQIGLDPQTGEMVSAQVEEQAGQALENLTGVLQVMGLDLSAVVKTTIFLTDMADFGRVNQVYAKPRTGFITSPRARSLRQARSVILEILPYIPPVTLLRLP
jgi:2-iminobutanoate/2-iminopropanoate deaminase